MRQLELSESQRSTLCRFILESRHPGQSDPGQFSKVLGYLMRNVDVRRPDTIADEFNRELVRATFEIIRCNHLLENNLITPARSYQLLDDVRDRITEQFAGLLPDLS